MAYHPQVTSQNRGTAKDGISKIWNQTPNYDTRSRPHQIASSMTYQMCEVPDMVADEVLEVADDPQQITATHPPR